MTAYRQQALACASRSRAAQAREGSAARNSDAGKILLHNVYGWFDRAERGVYVLTDAGRAALKRWPAATDGPQRQQFSALTTTTKKTGGWHDRGYRQRHGPGGQF